MTGKSRIVLWEPETVSIIKEVVKMRRDGILAWYSIDTGPSVFINTFKDHVKEVIDRLNTLKLRKIIVSGVGDKPSCNDDHLF